MLDEFNKSLRLYSATCPEVNYENVVNMPLDHIQSLGKEACFEYAHACMQYAIYLQRCENRERARLNVCKTAVHKLAGKAWKDYEVFGGADIKIAVIAGSGEHPKLAEYLEEKVKIEGRVQEISGLVHLTTKQADIFREMGRSK